MDAWSALPGTGRESKGGELGGTSEEHEEGIPEGPASFHRAAHDRLCRSATLHAGWPVWRCVFLLKTCGSKVLLGGRCGPESRISRLFAALSYCWYLPLIRAACTDACIPATQHYRDAKSRHLRTTGMRNPGTSKLPGATRHFSPASRAAPGAGWDPPELPLQLVLQGRPLLPS